jgi:DNA-binding protein H-NS
MLDIDLENLELPELKKLHKDVEKAITSFEARKKREALAAARAIAEENGYKLDELMSDSSSKKKSAPPKYKNPDNASDTWTGKGRQPKWFKDKVSAGVDPDTMLI